MSSQEQRMQVFEAVQPQQVFGELHRPQDPDFKSLLTWNEEQPQSTAPQWLSEMRESYRGFFFDAGNEQPQFRLKPGAQYVAPKQTTQAVTTQSQSNKAATKPQHTVKANADVLKTRTISNTTFSSHYNKPMFANYGQANVNPTYGGFASGHFMKSYNAKQGQVNKAPGKTSKTVKKTTFKDLPQETPQELPQETPQTIAQEQYEEPRREETAIPPPPAENNADPNAPLCEDCAESQQPFRTTYMSMSSKLPAKSAVKVSEPYNYCDECLATQYPLQAEGLQRPPNNLGEIPAKELNPRNYHSLPTKWTQRIPAAGKLSYRSPEAYNVIFYDADYA